MKYEEVKRITNKLEHELHGQMRASGMGARDYIDWYYDDTKRDGPSPFDAMMMIKRCLAEDLPEPLSGSL